MDNGQTGSIGQVECTNDTQCRERVDSALGPLAMPDPAMPVLTGSSCETLGITLDTGSFQGPACKCAFTDGPAGAMIGPTGDYCSWPGRSSDCLFSAREFQGCDVGSPASCDATCNDLRDRLAADNAHIFATEVRVARCESTGTCSKVLRVEDRCYADESLSKSYDCSLSNEEILRQASMPTSPGPCGDMAPGSGATCVGSVPDFFPRDPNEWQGMLVDMSVKPPCEMSSHCGLALACVDNYCGPCTADAQCADNEGCVLDHCVKKELIGCRHRADCSNGAFCILSGLTGGTARGNEDMRSYCN